MKKKVIPASICMVFVVALCFLVNISVNAPSVYQGTEGLFYEFSDSTAGIGGGNVILNSSETDTYSIYWGNNDNKLDGYSWLVQINAKQDEKSEQAINSYTMIPENVSQLLAYNSDNKLEYTYELPKSKLNNIGDYSYSVGLMSDVHFGLREDVPEEYPIIGWDNGTKYFETNNVSMILISGDLTAEGITPDFRTYSEKVDEFQKSNPKTPIYAVTGNHDCYCGDYGLGDYKSFAVDSEYYNGEFERKYYDDNVLDYTVSFGNDVYVFFNQTSANFSDNNPIYTEEQLDWLEKRLDENKNERIFVVSHPFIPGGAGDPTNGFYRYGVDNSVVKYSSAGPDINNESVKRFSNLINSNDNIIFFSGHSHFKFESQFLHRLDAKTFKIFDKDYNLYTNIYRDASLKTAALQVHIPSVSQPRSLRDEYDKASGIDKTEYLLERLVNYNTSEQCYIMEVYDDKIVLKGYDLMSKEQIAYATYIVNTNS